MNEYALPYLGLLGDFYLRVRWRVESYHASETRKVAGERRGHTRTYEEYP